MDIGKWGHSIKSKKIKQMKTIYYCKFPYDLTSSGFKSVLSVRKSKTFRSKLSDVTVNQSFEMVKKPIIVYNSMVTEFSYDFVEGIIKVWANYNGLKEPVIMNDLEFEKYINEIN